MNSSVMNNITYFSLRVHTHTQIHSFTHFIPSSHRLSLLSRHLICLPCFPPQYAICVYIPFLFIYFPFALSLHFSSLSLFAPIFHDFFATSSFALSPPLGGGGGGLPPFPCFIFIISDFFTISFSIFSIATTTPSPPSIAKKKERDWTELEHINSICISSRNFHFVCCVLLYSTHNVNMNWNWWT